MSHPDFSSPPDHVLVFDFMGRPWLANQAHQMHHREVSATRKEWSNAAIQLARIGKLGRHQAITLVVWTCYPSGTLPDPDAPQPATKGVLDGLVRAGVIPDDNGDHVQGILYVPSLSEPDADPALIVEIRVVS